MREELKKKLKANKREPFKATFERFGKRKGYKYPLKTICLNDIVDRRTLLVTDHLWMDCGKTFDSLKLIEGDKIQFDARPKVYEKGYEGVNDYGEECFTTIDYGLCYPSKAKKIKNYIITIPRKKDD